MSFYPWFSAFCLVAGVLYAILIISFLNGWHSIPEFFRKRKIYSTKVSVILPFFNEEDTLIECIEGLLHQSIQTSEFEIILVDDQSTDNSTSIARKYADKYQRISYLRSNVKGKKHALIQGINSSNGELIVTTDADCTYGKNWLATIVEYYEEFQPNMIVGPVVLETGESKFQQFQQIEFISLIASGAGAIGINHPIMCNGANLAFRKSVFLKMKDPLNLGYISGDDVFLLHSMKKLGNEKIHFLKSKDAFVSTLSQIDKKSFLKQRVRWVSKAKGYNDGDTKFTAIVVFAASFLWVLGIPMMVFSLKFAVSLLFLFLVKTSIDMFFLHQVSEFFGQKKQLKQIPQFEFFYGLYVAAVVFRLVLIKSKKFRA